MVNKLLIILKVALSVHACMVLNGVIIVADIIICKSVLMAPKGFLMGSYM